MQPATNIRKQVLSFHFSNSWETIFSKSTDAISEIEMECCRRITQLCKDCLLIVYQFASEAKNKQQADNDVGR